jgi:beta-alanine--pyruvate transaminase
VGAPQTPRRFSTDFTDTSDYRRNRRPRQHRRFFLLSPSQNPCQTAAKRLSFFLSFFRLGLRLFFFHHHRRAERFANDKEYAMSPNPPLSAFWMPFSSNKNFKAHPRMLVGAKDMHYRDADGAQVLDATAGLWCCNAGHCREPIVRAVQQQVAELDFGPTFQLGHPKAFELAARLADGVFPGDLNAIFFTNSGSEAVDSALKIALAYHKVRGQGGKTRLIGRERGYHGVNFGGISVGGIVKNKMFFNNQLAAVSHLPHTHDPARNAFTRGRPEHGGAEFADALSRLIALHDASAIAAVIVEPVAGSTGVLIPPLGYLERLREICDANDILLIFDEVITGFGRLGKKTAADFFGVMPDMITFAKGVTSGVAPMGGVAVREDICRTFMDAAADNAIDFFHGYTYSGHPLAAAAGLGALEVYEGEGLFERAGELASEWENAMHSLRDLPNVVDIRNIGLIGAIELAPRKGAPGARAFDAFVRAFHEQHLLIRVTGDIIALSPPLIAQKSHIAEIADKLGKILKSLD